MINLHIARRYILAGAAVLGLSLLLYALRQYVGPDPAPSAPLLLLLVVFLTAVQAGLGPALLAALVAVLCYNFFFLTPYYTFTIGRVEDVVAFAVFFAVAVVASRLAAQSAGRAQDAEARLQETTALNNLSRMLLERGSVADDEIARAVARTLTTQAVGIYLDDEQLTVAQFGTAQDAGNPTAAAPLQAANRTLGRLTVQRAAGQPAFGEGDRRLLTTVASLLTGAVERERLAADAQEAAVLREADAVKSSLLAAASHELRTPLAAIKGAASSLLQEGGNLSNADRRELLEAVDSEADRLSRLVNNLLDLSRVEAGALHVETGLYSIAEVINTAISSLGNRLDSHPLTFDLPADLPLVPLDYVLIQQVVSNLLDNAARYTPPATPIMVAANVDGGDLLVVVEDDGPGLPPDELSHIFDRFYRAGRQRGQQGIGIGLTLAQGFVEAHGGRMWAANAVGGGLRVSFTLPLQAAFSSPLEGEAGRG